MEVGDREEVMRVSVTPIWLRSDCRPRAGQSYQRVSTASLGGVDHGVVLYGKVDYLGLPKYVCYFILHCYSK